MKISTDHDLMGVTCCSVLAAVRTQNKWWRNEKSRSGKLDSFRQVHSLI